MYTRFNNELSVSQLSKVRALDYWQTHRHASEILARRAILQSVTVKNIFGRPHTSHLRQLDVGLARRYGVGRCSHHSCISSVVAGVLFIYEMCRVAAVIWLDKFRELCADDMVY